MATPNASHNIGFHFPAAKFRNAIQFVFEMAAPPEAGIGLKFHFADTVTPDAPYDGDLVPFDPSESFVRTTPTPLSVPCDVQFVASSEETTAFGSVIPSKLKVLLLDEDYVKVAAATFVVMNGDRYNRSYEEPSFGLFDVGLHTIIFVAEDEV